MPEWLNYCFSISWLPHSYNNSYIPEEVDYIKKKNYLIFILLFWIENTEKQQKQ